MLRVIAGELRGRKLLPPKDRDITRPITDRVKQSVFDFLASRAMFDQTHVLDLFSGTGSLGIEAISRGAQVVTFVDQDRGVIEQLENNIDALGIRDRSRVQRVSVTSMLWLSAAIGEGPIDLAFIDPPYAMIREADQWAAVELVLQKLLGHMNPWGLAVVRVPDKIDAHELEGWSGPRVDSYGSMRVWYYQSPGGEAGEKIEEEG